MDRRNLISKIQREDITFIQEEVSVQFDNRQQTPLGFQWHGRHYEVLELILVSRKSGESLNYVVLTDGGVFNLTLVRDQETATFSRSRWVLKYRVNDDTPVTTAREPVAPVVSNDSASNAFLLQQGEASLFVPLCLANIVHFHGHLCPELAIGYRVGLIAQNELCLTRNKAHDFFILAENMSSSIDALQYMTGCTVGNQCFYAYDLGKHVYYFGRFHAGREPREALRVAVINPLVNVSHKHASEKKIMAGQAASVEVQEYHKLIHKAVMEILNLPEESLFTKSKVSLRPPQLITACDYTRCSGCGEVVAVRKTIPGEKGVLCQVCVAKIL